MLWPIYGSSEVIFSTFPTALRHPRHVHLAVPCTATAAPPVPWPSRLGPRARKRGQQRGGQGRPGPGAAGQVGRCSENFTRQPTRIQDCMLLIVMNIIYIYTQNKSLSKYPLYKMRGVMVCYILF